MARLSDVLIVATTPTLLFLSASGQPLVPAALPALYTPNVSSSGRNRHEGRRSPSPIPPSRLNREEKNGTKHYWPMLRNVARVVIPRFSRGVKVETAEDSLQGLTLALALSSSLKIPLAPLICVTTMFV